MKKLNLLLIAIFALGSVSMAQEQRGERRNMDPEAHATEMTQRMVKQLSLTDDQAKELKAVNLEFTTQMKASRDEMRKGAQEQSASNEKPQMNGMPEKYKAAIDAYEAKIQKILTKEQYEQYLKTKSERRGPKPSEGK